MSWSDSDTMKRQAGIDYTRKHDLAIDEVRACPLFANCTDEQLQGIVETLKTFSKIAYDLYKKEQKSLDKPL